MSRGWRLSGAAWRLMRQDPTMIALALIGTACGLAGAGLMLYLGGVFSPDRYSRVHFGTIALLFLYPLTFVGVFFNVALTAAASATLEGRWIGVGGALAEAWRRAGRIAQWSLLAVGVGVLIDQIASRIPAAGRLVGRLLGAAWGLATIFAIPLLTLENAGPVEAARGSAGLVRSRWGEGLTGIVGIGAWTTVAFFPVAIVGAVGFAVAPDDAVVGIGLIGLSAAGFVGAVALSNATRQVFNLALFRYATGVGTPGFEVADLEDPFTRKEARRRTRAWAWIALAIVVGLIALAAIFGQDRPGAGADPGDWYASWKPGVVAGVHVGTPVLYRGRVVGSVFQVGPDGSEVRVGYHVDPSLPGEGGGPIEVVGGRRVFLRLHPPR